MKYSLDYYKTGDFGVILENVHSQMKRYLTFKRDQKIAEKMEVILRQLKHTVKQLRDIKSGSAVVDKINTQYAQLVQDIFDEQVSIHSSLGSATGLFSRAHRKNTDKTKFSIEGTDDIFEEEMAFFLTTAAKKAQLKKQYDINVDIFLMGTQNVMTKSMQNNLQLDIEKQLLNIPVEAIKEARRSAEAAARLGGIAQIRSGKVDLESPGFEVYANAQDIYSTITKLFSGHTFTLKNYSSFKQIVENKVERKDYSEINLHLGDSNLYKSITGSLSRVYSEPKIQKTIYYRGMEYLAGKTQDQDTTSVDVVRQHFAHLRFIYELRGQGLISVETGESKVADFLIWNDPNSEEIFVRSTNSLINKLAEKYTNPFAAIKLSAADLT